MASGDFFDVPEIDVFDSEVDALVISVYKATIAGIEVLNKRERAGFKTRGIDSDAEVQQESWWWDDQIEAMKYHAGDMGLVSLVLLFQDWLKDRHEEVFRGEKNAVEWRSQFEHLTEGLPEGPLPLAELEDMVTARDSIIHHRGEPTFKNPKKKKNQKENVNERFRDFVEASGRERVAIDESLLADLATKVKSFVQFWHDQRLQTRMMGCPSMRAKALSRAWLFWRCLSTVWFAREVEDEDSGRLQRERVGCPASHVSKTAKGGAPPFHSLRA